MTDSSRQQLISAARRALDAGDRLGACDHLRDALEIEFEPDIAAAISQIEGGGDVDLGTLAPDPFAFDEAPESGIDADLFGMELVVEEEEPDTPVDPADDPSGFDDAFAPESSSPRVPSRVRYRGVAPPPPVHRSRTSDSWLAHQDTVAPLDAPETPVLEPVSDDGLDDLDDLDDWDLGGSPNASASSATIERQQVGFDDLSGAMQPTGHLPGMRDAFVEPEVDDGNVSALPAELVPEPSDFIDDPVSRPPQDDDTRPPTGDGGDATHWLEVEDASGGPAALAPAAIASGPVRGTADPFGETTDDPFDAFAESSLASMLGDSLEHFGPAPADAGAAATFDVRMHSRPRQPVVANDRAEDTRPGEAVVQEDARPTRPATAPLRWEPDVVPASRVDDGPSPGREPARPESPARTGRTLSGWRSGPQWAVPDEPTPTSDDGVPQGVAPHGMAARGMAAQGAGPTGGVPAHDAGSSPDSGPSDAQIEATRAAFARQASIDRRTDQGRPAGMAAPLDTAPARDPSRLTEALMEVSDLFIVGELDQALARLDGLTEWSDHPDVLRFRDEIEKAREQRLAELVEPVTRVPMANANADAAALAALNPRRMFIVSLADGMATIEDLIDMSGMPTEDARRAIGSLIASGVLVFDE